MLNDFGTNLNSLFMQRAPNLRFEEDETLYGVVIDDKKRMINTIPILEYEERYLSSDSSMSYTYLHIRSYGHHEETVCIPSSELFNSKTFIRNYGNKPFADFDNDSWNIFFEVMRVTLSEIDQRVIYNYSGWSKDFDSYLFGNLMVDAYNVMEVETSLVKSKTLLSKTSAAQVCRVANEVATSISSNPLVGYSMITYLMLSHTKPRFVIAYRKGPEFIVCIVGETGSFKTNASIGMFNTHDGTVASFEDTLASVRRVFQSCKSGVTIVDDYKTSSPKNDAQFEKLVRLSGDIQTTGKYVVGNKVVDELVTGMSIITGEVRPKLQQSSYSRVLFLDVSDNPISQEYLTILQDSKAEINSFIVLFIQFILQYEDYDKDTLESVEKYREELYRDVNFKGMHMRYYSMYAWLATMWDWYEMLMSKYGVSVDFDFKSQIREYIRSQHNLYDNDPIRLFKEAYVELVAANEIVIVDKKGVDNKDFDVVEQDGELFFKSNGAFKKILKYWQDKGIDFTVSEKKLRVLLNEVGIHEKINGKMTVERKTKDNKSYSGYILYKNKLLNYGSCVNEEN